MCTNPIAIGGLIALVVSVFFIGFSVNREIELWRKQRSQRGNDRQDSNDK